MQRIFNWYRDNAGNAISGATVTVYEAGSITPAIIYEPDANSTPVSAKSNPFTTDANGFWQFAAANGAYAVKIEGAGVSQMNIQYVYLFDGEDGVLSVSDYGAVGDGVTDDSNAIESAVAAAYAGRKYLFFPDGNYLTTRSIALFHQVHKYGPGLVKRSSNTFTVSQIYGETNTIYIATTGSDSNDGLSASQPFLTLQAAVDVLNYSSSPYSDGPWVFSLAAGTYGGLVTFPENVRGRSQFTIVGPVVNHPNVPTAILSGGGSQAYGINFNGNNKATISNIKVTGFTSYGVVCQDFCDITTINVHASAVSGGPGIKAQQSRLRVRGGIIDTCQTGVTAISCTVFTIGDGAASTADGTQITACTQAGLFVQENSTGHLDYCTIDNCAVGVDAVVNSRVNATSSVIKNNATSGVRCKVSSNWFNNGSTLTGNAINELIYDTCSEISREGSRTAESRQALDIVFVSHTGTAVQTTLKTYANAIYQDSFNSQVKSYRIIIYGELTGTAGTKNVLVRLAGSDAFGFTIPAAATGSYWIEGTVRAQNGSAQSYSATCFANGQNPQVSTGSRSISMITGSAIPATILVTLGSAADTLTIRGVEQFNAGGC